MSKFLAGIFVAAALAAAFPHSTFAKNPVAVVKTNMGTFKIELYQDDAPKTVKNFVGLAKQKFFDGLRFHRVIKGFVIQGGDPKSKDPSKMNEWGTGGGSIFNNQEFEDELNPATPSYKAGYQKYVVAMANHGPNTNSSQFFVMCGGNLPHQYTIFGKVTSGMDVVDRIDNVETIRGVDRPKQDVIMEHVTIE